MVDTESARVTDFFWPQGGELLKVPPGSYQEPVHLHCTATVKDESEAKEAGRNVRPWNDNLQLSHSGPSLTLLISFLAILHVSSI